MAEECKKDEKKPFVKCWCSDLDKDCYEYEDGYYSDLTKRTYERCWNYGKEEKGLCPFLAMKNMN
jgi:hypothetical protein